MRQSFSIAPDEEGEAEVTVSAVPKSGMVRLNAVDDEFDAARVELSVEDAKVLRGLLDQAIKVAEKPYNPYAITINSGAISAQSLINDYYGSYLRTLPRPSYGRFF